VSCDLIWILHGEETALLWLCGHGGEGWRGWAACGLGWIDGSANRRRHGWVELLCLGFFYSFFQFLFFFFSFAAAQRGFNALGTGFPD
jgi:hypothetical protein